jgi:small-conductance mechanosensitive channel
VILGAIAVIALILIVAQVVASLKDGEIRSHATRSRITRARSPISYWAFIFAMAATALMIVAGVTGAFR